MGHICNGGHVDHRAVDVGHAPFPFEVVDLAVSVLSSRVGSTGPCSHCTVGELWWSGSHGPGVVSYTSR